MNRRKQFIALLAVAVLLSGLVSGAGAFPYWCEQCEDITEFYLRDESETYTGDKVCLVCGWVAERGVVINLAQETQTEEPSVTDPPEEAPATPADPPEESAGSSGESTNPPVEMPNQPPEEQNKPDGSNPPEEPVIILFPLYEMILSVPNIPVCTPL